MIEFHFFRLHSRFPYVCSNKNFRPSKPLTESGFSIRFDFDFVWLVECRIWYFVTLEYLMVVHVWWQVEVTNEQNASMEYMIIFFHCQCRSSLSDFGISIYWNPERFFFLYWIVIEVVCLAENRDFRRWFLASDSGSSYTLHTNPKIPIAEKFWY